MRKHWCILNPEGHLIDRMVDGLSCHPVIAAVLANRQVANLEEARAFMDPSFRHLRPPHDLKDIGVAVRRIFSALKKRENILVFGDYDVDGLAATTLLFVFLRGIGARVSYYIPHRIQEGYGLQPSHIPNIVQSREAQLIITADCGSSSYAAVDAASAAGVDVIVTDHHNLPDKLPHAVAVINPKRRDCPSNLAHLAGAGVAFYLLIHLRAYLRQQGFWFSRPEPNLKRLCDLVALGTIADMVPLLAENRVLTRAGLDVLNSCENLGLKALINHCRLNLQRIDAEEIAFRLAPHLNAAGRLDHAEQAMRLLLVTNGKDAQAAAQALGRLNGQRQEMERALVEEICQGLSRRPYLMDSPAWVLSQRDWHQGILGIAASRLVKRYQRPVVLLSVRDGLGKGSGRSIPGFNLYRGLQACAPLLESFGGHAMAAGLKIRTENLPEFRRRLEDQVRQQAPCDDFSPTVTIDCKLNFHSITGNLIDELDLLRPFGTANPEPLFMATAVSVIESQIVGGCHRRMVLRQEEPSSPVAFKAIQFGVDTQRPLPNAFERIAYHLRWNVWNGRRHPQLVISEAESR